MGEGVEFRRSEVFSTLQSEGTESVSREQIGGPGNRLEGPGSRVSREVGVGRGGTR